MKARKRGPGENEEWRMGFGVVCVCVCVCVEARRVGPAAVVCCHTHTNSFACPSF